jgi:hypothetical protein
VLAANTASVLGGATTSSPGALNIDISRFSPTDIVKFLVVPTNAASGTGTLTITFYDDQINPSYISYTATGLTFVANTPYILAVPISSFTATTGSGSNPFNYTISGISVQTNQTSLSADAITIDDTDITDTTYGLVSRTVLGTVITKNEGDSLDIEYQLSLSIG